MSPQIYSIITDWNQISPQSLISIKKHTSVCCDTQNIVSGICFNGSFYFINKHTIIIQQYRTIMTLNYCLENHICKVKNNSFCVLFFFQQAKSRKVKGSTFLFLLLFLGCRFFPGQHPYLCSYLVVESRWMRTQQPSCSADVLLS